MTTHTALIARLEAGETGPEIDVLFHVAMHPDDTILLGHDASVGMREYISQFPAAFDQWDGLDDWCDVAPVIGAKPITTSLDAVAAATPERWRVYGITSIRGGATWSVILAGPDGEHVTGNAPTICGAWAAAILRADGGER